MVSINPAIGVFVCLLYFTTVNSEVLQLIAAGTADNFGVWQQCLWGRDYTHSLFDLVLIWIHAKTHFQVL